MTQIVSCQTVSVKVGVVSCIISLAWAAYSAWLYLPITRWQLTFFCLKWGWLWFYLCAPITWKDNLCHIIMLAYSWAVAALYVYGMVYYVLSICLWCAVTVNLLSLFSHKVTLSAASAFWLTEHWINSFRIKIQQLCSNCVARSRGTMPSNNDPQFPTCAICAVKIINSSLSTKTL